MCFSFLADNQSNVGPYENRKLHRHAHVVVTSGIPFTFLSIIRSIRVLITLFSVKKGKKIQLIPDKKIATETV